MSSFKDAADAVASERLHVAQLAKAIKKLEDAELERWKQGCDTEIGVADAETKVLALKLGTPPEVIGHEDCLGMPGIPVQRSLADAFADSLPATASAVTDTVGDAVAAVTDAAVSTVANAARKFLGVEKTDRTAAAYASLEGTAA